MKAFVAVLCMAAAASAGLVGPQLAYGGAYGGVYGGAYGAYAAPAVASLPISTYSTHGARISQSVRAVAAPVAYAQPAVQYAAPAVYHQPAVAYAAPAITKTIAPVAQSTAFVNRAPAARLAVAAPAVAYAHAPVATYAHAAPVATYAHAPAVAAAPLGVSYGAVGAVGALGYGSAYYH